MSTQPRIKPADSTQDANFGSVMSHIPEPTRLFFELYGQLWQQGVVDDELRELTRLRNAQITDCGY